MKPNEQVIIDLINQGILSIDNQGNAYRHYDKNLGWLNPPRKMGSMNSRGYLQLRVFQTTSNGRKWITAMLHRIVFILYGDGIPNGLEINHKDGNKLNNNVENLEICTRAGNIIHAIKMGLKPSKCGEDASLAKLTWEQVREIRKRHAKGIKKGSGSTHILAKEFGVHRGTIQTICNQETWKE